MAVYRKKENLHGQNHMSQAMQKIYLQTCAKYADSDHPAHAQSNFQAFYS